MAHAPIEEIRKIEPVDAEASASVHAVLDYCHELMGRTDSKLMSGQFIGWYPEHSMDAIDQIYAQTGKHVAIIGIDYYEPHQQADDSTEPHTHKPPRWREVNPLAKEYWARGGLPALSVHMSNPYTGGKSWDVSIRADFDMLDAGTEVGQRYLQQIDEIADGLEDLQKEGIVVLFRPFHEAQGAWFWWGAPEPELGKAMWRHMFDYYTKERGLHNLIWVNNNPLNLYPGNDTVDMNSFDCYSTTPVDKADLYEEMVHTGKPYAIAEFGPSGSTADPDSDRNHDYSTLAQQAMEIGSGVVYFLTWRDAWGLHRNPGSKELLSNPLVLNRDDLVRELVPRISDHPLNAPSST
ncbi:glycosyl hydrolase [Coraliomargarita parva]|uniref:glycosyl hydrolase n=1 Tax=Coraliomargarita parva TaxID=3014050 RepID=UPI0022B5A480|nr:glycosyl hydrolase [Coraliomargarita parva]